MTISLLLGMTAAGCTDTKPDWGLAQRISEVYDKLDAIVFVAEIDEKHTGLSDLPAVDRKVVVKVAMADGGKYRVEAFHGETPLGTAVCDGKEIFEWDPRENLWTRFPVEQRDGKNLYRPKLIREPSITLHAGSWVGTQGSLGERIAVLTGDRGTRKLPAKTVDGRECDVLEYRNERFELHQGIPLNSGERDTLYFDRDTYFLIRESHVVHGTVLFAPYFKGSIDTTYTNVTLNPILPHDTFVFAPPEDSTYIAPDAPRFRRSVTLGQPAPDLELSQVDGTKVSLSDFKDKKVVLMAFWATWCGPCQQEMPTLSKLHEEFGEKGLAVIGVSTDDNLGTLKSFLKRKKVPYTILHDAKDQSGKLYYVKSIPHTVLIDKKGMVVKTWQGWAGEEEEKEIRAALAELGIGQ